MNVRRAFTFVFDDPRWASKLGIAILLSVVPALIGFWSLWSGPRGAGFMTAPAVVASPLFTPVSSIALIPLNGFLLRITRDVVAGFDVPLPEWSDIRGILRDGARLWALLTLWSLPGIAARLLVGDAGDIPGQSAFGPEALVSLGEVVIFIVQPAAVAWLATTGSLAAAVNVGAVLATVRRNLGRYVLVFLITTGLFFLSLGLSAVLLWPLWRGVGRSLSLNDLPVFIAASISVAVLVFAPYLSYVQYHLYGQAFVRANRLQQPLSLQPGGLSEPRRSEPIIADHPSPRRRRHRERPPGASRTGGRRRR